MTSVYRLCSSRYPANRGDGARLFGGRWNRPGTEAIYAAQSASLAALEILVHYSTLPADFAMTEIVIPDAVPVVRLTVNSLPVGWDQEVPSSITQDLGQEWLRKSEHAVLCVPSSIVPTDFNYVINPAHPAFSEIVFGTPTPFRFDPRLK